MRRADLNSTARRSLSCLDTHEPNPSSCAIEETPSGDGTCFSLPSFSRTRPRSRPEWRNTGHIKTPVIDEDSGEPALFSYRRRKVGSILWHAALRHVPRPAPGQGSWRDCSCPLSAYACSRFSRPTPPKADRACRARSASERMSGTGRFEIGFWVGSANTPNTYSRSSEPIVPMLGDDRLSKRQPSGGRRRRPY